MGKIAVRSHLRRHLSGRKLLSAVVLLASAGFLGYKAYSSWGAFKAYHWQVHFLGLIPSALLFLLQFAVIVFGWQQIMTGLAPPLRFWDHVRIYGYTHLLQRIPAGSVWVVAGRAYAYKGQNVPARLSALGSFLELVVVLLSGLPLAALAAHLLGLLSLVPAALLAALALAVEIAALHPRVLGRVLGRARHETLPVQLSYRDSLIWGFTYTLVWLLSGTGLFLIARLFTPLSLSDLPRTIGVWVISSLIAYLTVLSPSGLGVKELTLTVLLSLFLPDPLPLLIALAIRVVWTGYDMLIGVAAWLL